MTHLNRICVVPTPQGVGGMVSFQARFVEGVRKRGIEVSLSLEDLPYQAVLVIGGTRQLAGLWRARKMGIPVVQRLNGMNWLHRKRRTGGRHFLRAELGNLLLSIIRTHIASFIVYQSNFSHHWWERVYGSPKVPNKVIFNGVDVTRFSPAEDWLLAKQDHYRLLLVEGTLGGGYEMGIDSAIQLGNALFQHGISLELLVVGRTPQYLQDTWQDRSQIPIQWLGLLSQDQVIEIDRSAHLFYSSDLNPACPNAVIEAMACGLPVLAFDTGALPELVTGDAGCVMPYGGDPWALDPPDIESLACAATHLLTDLPHYRKAARQHVLQTFDVENMIDSYLEVLGNP